MKSEAEKPSPIERIVASIGSVASLILHTVVFFASFMISVFGLVEWSFMLLILTTILSLEAIYLAIFIQITVNRQAQSIKEIEEDIEEVQEDVEEISEDIEEMQEDVEEMSEDIDEIQEDVEELSEEEEIEALDKKHTANLEQLTADVKKLLLDLEALKSEKK
jgi:uncharacterized membrane protein